MENITTSTTTEQIPQITEPLENHKKYFRQRDAQDIWLPINFIIYMYKTINLCHKRFKDW